MKISILTPGFTTPNGRAFLFPLLLHRRVLREAGLDLALHQSISDALYDCDILLVDSKFHRDRWLDDTAGILAEFESFRSRIGKIVYCDTTDSSGSVQTELLPVIDIYAKAQLLQDRREYLRPHYGFRIYSDYYHRHYAVADASPAWSTPVPSEALLDKLKVSWHSGLADYSVAGPLRMALYQRLAWPGLLAYPRCFTPAGRVRRTPVQMRMGVNYDRASVAFQRQDVRRRLAKYSDGRKLDRWAYWRELRDSQVVISPFGLGEITLKDFEVLLAGGCLVKPDMSHLETWPAFFRKNESYAAFHWDCSDLEEVVNGLLAEPARRQSIAEAGQALYRAHLGPGGGELFVDHFKRLLQEGARV